MRRRSRHCPSLAHGVFATRTIAAGERISPCNVFLAIPGGENQLSTRSLSKYTVHYATEHIPAKAALTCGNTRGVELREKVDSIVHHVQGAYLHRRRRRAGEGRHGDIAPLRPRTL